APPPQPPRSSAARPRDCGTPCAPGRGGGALSRDHCSPNAGRAHCPNESHRPRGLSPGSARASPGLNDRPRVPEPIGWYHWPASIECSIDAQTPGEEYSGLRAARGVALDCTSAVCGVGAAAPADLLRPRRDVHTRWIALFETAV